jgi:hypothetical protein
VSKHDILEAIEEDGCDMLNNKLDGTETKKEIVRYLKHCDCPVLKAKFDITK